MDDVKLVLESALADLNLAAPRGARAGGRLRQRWCRGRWGAGDHGRARCAWWLRPAPPAAAAVLQRVTNTPGLNAFPALSRDGNLLAFASDRSEAGNLDIWIQQIGGRDSFRLTTHEADDTDPSISPDGTRVAFRSERDGGGIYVASCDGRRRDAPGARRSRTALLSGWQVDRILGRPRKPGTATRHRAHLRHRKRRRTTPPGRHGSDCRRYILYGRPRAMRCWRWGGVMAMVRRCPGLVDCYRLLRGSSRETGARAVRWPSSICVSTATGMPRSTCRSSGVSGWSCGIRIGTRRERKFVGGAAEGRQGEGASRPASRTGPDLHLQMPRRAPGSDNRPRMAFSSLEWKPEIWSQALDADRGVIHGELERSDERTSPRQHGSVAFGATGRYLAFVRRQLGRTSMRLRELRDRQRR